MYTGIIDSESADLSRRRPTLGVGARPAGSLFRAASLIELLVVISIMGIMMGLLLPALHRARLRADETVCDNNGRQLRMALSQFIDTKDRFPAPHQWTVDLLPWIEQRPLADIMKQGYSLGADFPRPPLMQCPFQDNFASRFPNVSVCHYMLVVDRDENGLPIRDQPGWTISDRGVLNESAPEEPWYFGPETTHLTHQRMLALEQGPHPGGRFDTEHAYWK